MTDFILDPRLQADCEVLMVTDRCHYLLHRNADVAWFLIVPVTTKTEFYRLESDLQFHLCEEIGRVSDFVQTRFNSDKLNVATLGNVVSQMHIHVVGRYHNDPYWPDAVWGAPVGQLRSVSSINVIRDQFTDYMTPA